MGDAVEQQEAAVEATKETLNEISTQAEVAAAEVLDEVNSATGTLETATADVLAEAPEVETFQQADSLPTSAELDAEEALSQLSVSLSADPVSDSKLLHGAPKTPEPSRPFDRGST